MEDILNEACNPSLHIPALMTWMESLTTNDDHNEGTYIKTATYSEQRVH